MDVCSVKLLPAQILFEVLGKKCRVLATHPLFGPQSLSKGDGQVKNIVWHEIVGGPFKELEDLVTNKLGLTIIRMSPEEHDKQMAWVHGLTFFIGRGLMEMNPPRSALTTNYYERLMSAVDVEKHHSYELFKSIQLGNIYSGQIRKDFLRIMQTLDEQLREDHI
jgi:prephenate dehydrogenase